MQSSMQRGVLPAAPGANPLSGSGGRQRPAGRAPGRPSGGLQVVAAVKRGSDKTIVCSKTVVAKKGSEAAVQDLCQQVPLLPLLLASQVHAALVKGTTRPPRDSLIP